MDEAYRIDVLHIVNPHLMFVESHAQKTPVIEQVGIFGVLPVNITIDIDGNVVAERCENWPIAANTILREFLVEHKNSTYFVPIENNETSTILDNTTHIFGDIVIGTGKELSATQQLINSSIAVKDECVFHKKLTSGSIKVKLNRHRKAEVLNAIKRYYEMQSEVKHDWRKTVEKQTSLFEEGNKIIAELTEQNLKLFERNSTHYEQVKKAIEKKENNLNLCKDADMVSVGCGVTRKRNTNLNLSSPSKGSVSEEKDEHSLTDVLSDMKKYLDVKGKRKDALNCNKSPEKENQEERSHNLQENNEGSSLIYAGRGTQKLDSMRGTVNLQRKLTNNDIKQTSASDISDNKYKPRICVPQSGKKVPQPRVLSPQKPASRLKPMERLLIYCPDMIMSSENTQSFIPIKVIEDFGTDTVRSPVLKVKEIDSSIFNDDDNTDSNIGIDITNLARLKSVGVTQTVGQTEPQTKLNNQDHSKSNNNQSYTQTSHSETQTTSKNVTDETTAKPRSRLTSSILQRKLQALKEKQNNNMNSSLSSNSDTSVKDTSSSPEQSKVEHKWSKPKTEPVIKIQESKISLVNIEHAITESNVPDLEPVQPIKPVEPEVVQYVKVKRNVDPIKNLDGSTSTFVDKLLKPALMVHTKNDNLIIPQVQLRDIPFKPDTISTLLNSQVRFLKKLQTVSCSCILRGHSVFMISPARAGKTLGYVPAVCNIVSDFNLEIPGMGPVAIIVCATALSVTQVENYCKGSLGLESIVACYPGIETSKITTALLNGCHVLICTATMLVSLLERDFGVDLRRLMVLVLDDCERLAQVYTTELNKILKHVKHMLKNRSDKALKVQYVVASRQWCDFMTPLAKRVPDTVIVIGASQECVLYSKTVTAVNFVRSQDSKVNAVVEFMQEIDSSKRTIIVCREDHEVLLLENTLTKLKYTVFACNNSMKVEDLPKLNKAWDNYREPVVGPVLICCDPNLIKMNITNGNYLVHFSMPELFSQFCKRFSVLNENYASIFGPEKENLKIKILLDENNVEQLPKILDFVKRCTNAAFPLLENISQEVLKQKDFNKARDYVSICSTLLLLGECVDRSNCNMRHTVFKEFDIPKDWMPKHGVVTFKIIRIHSATHYSARVLTHTTNSDTTRYPNNYKTLSLKMSRHYSKEINRKSHGVPKVGDICAVAVKENFYERCQVIELPRDKSSNLVRINQIDHEHDITTSDVYLFYLPDDLKQIETHVVQVRLASVRPKDKDVTFSVAAKHLLKKSVEPNYADNLYMRGRVAMTLGNCLFVDSLECCADLSSLGETVVKHDLRNESLERHAEPFPEHIEELKKLTDGVISIEEIEPIVNRKEEKRPKWAHLDKNDLSTVFFTTAVDAETLFVRHAKFKSILNLLQQDILEYAEKAPELAKEEIYVGNIVLAEYPDDKVYERARIDAVLDDRNVKCFFVDNGDWRQVAKKSLKLITENILHRIPFQAIECRLVGVKPPSGADDWPEFGTSWLEDNCFEDNDGNVKYLYVKYFTKEKATVTGGNKYGVVLVDTSSNEDVIINKKMIDLNLASANEDEFKYIEEPLNIKPVKFTNSSSNEDISTVKDSTIANETVTVTDLVPVQPDVNNWNETNSVKRSVLFEKPIRSVPLVDSDNESDISDKWDVVIDKDMLGMFGPPSKSNVTEYKSEKDATDDHTNITPKKPTISEKSESDNVPKDASDTKRGSTNSSISNTEISKVISERVCESPTLVSQYDSDDPEIGNDSTNSLGILKNIPFNFNVPAISPYKPDTVKFKNYGKVSSFIDNKTKKDDTLDSDDLSSACEAAITISEAEPARKPKLVWRQNKKTVTVKIILIGVEEYVLDIKERNLNFKTWHNDTLYEFNFVLYGVVNPDKSMHSNKGQYIQVTLVKMLQRKWSNLTKECSASKWIVYDVDAIEYSSDEDENNDNALEAIKQNHEKEETESEDEDFDDDNNFRYKRDLDD